MSLNLYNEKGNLGQLCTNAGWGELIDSIDVKDYPEMKTFLSEGSSDNVKQLLKEVKDCLTRDYPDTVISTLKNLQDILPSDSEVAIVSS